MISNWRLRYFPFAAICSIAILTTALITRPLGVGVNRDISLYSKALHPGKTDPWRDQLQLCVAVNREISVYPHVHLDRRGNSLHGVQILLSSNVEFDDKTWRVIEQQEKPVLRIYVASQFVTDDVLRRLATQQQLREIDLRPTFSVDSNQTDPSWNLRPLESLEQLERLNLGEIRVSAAAWQAIGRIRNLKSLEMYGSRIDFQGSLPTAIFKNLEHLTIDSCQIEDWFLAGIRAIPSLKELTLSENKITAAGIRSLSGTRLTNLNLRKRQVDDLDAVLEISSLKVLNIPNLTDEEFTKLEKHPNLAIVNASNRGTGNGKPFPRNTKRTVWALQPNNNLEKSLPSQASTNAPNQAQSKIELSDPTKQTIFRVYSERNYGELVDAATGSVLKRDIGIGWIGSQTSCIFSSDGSHVAIISRHHDNYRSGSTDFEQLWLFALRPFRQINESKSKRFENIRFASDNTALVFESAGPPKIDGP